MSFSIWLCSSNSTKNMLVKIVHPGGHVELHDRPVMASEIMLRNPKCVVAHPNVFKEPWAVVAPDTMLNLGQKFYVVPVSTIRKLQRANSLKHSPPVQEHQTKESHQDSCPGRNLSKDRCFSDDNCFKCLVTGMGTNKGSCEDSSEGTRSSSSFSSSETKRFTRKRNKDFTKESPNKFATMDPWQPSLQSINEDYGSNQSDRSC